MTKRSLYIGLAFAILVAIGLPFLFSGKDETPNQTLNLSATIISAISSVLTLLIAILLFNKYGVDQPFIEKSSAKVFALLEQIKKTNFSISSDKISYFRVPMSDPFKHNKWIERYYSEKLVFAEYYINDLVPLFEISNNPFIPPAISQKMDSLQFWMMTYDVDDGRLSEYAKVQVVGGEKIQYVKFGRFNGEDLTVFEFLTLLDNIANEIKDWIQKNSTTPIKLNL